MPLMVSIDHTWGEGDMQQAVEDRNTEMHTATLFSTDLTIIQDLFSINRPAACPLSILHEAAISP